VCISHATGAGGEEVGRLAAESLGYRYVDDEIVARAAAAGGITPAEVADAERRKSLAARLVEAIGQSGEAWALVSGHTAPGWEGHSSDDVRALVRETISLTAAQGKVVIVAHGASHAVSRTQEALRVLVTASAETRAARIAAATGGDRARAEREVKDADAARRDYLMRFYDIREESPTQYDLVVNTERLSAEQVARLVSLLAAA
jgi:cytidylate kinase